MSKGLINRIAVALGETHIREANVMTTPNATARFWIITMMLVLLGLSTLSAMSVFAKNNLPRSSRRAQRKTSLISSAFSATSAVEIC